MACVYSKTLLSSATPSPPPGGPASPRATAVARHRPPGRQPEPVAGPAGAPGPGRLS